MQKYWSTEKYKHAQHSILHQGPISVNELEQQSVVALKRSICGTAELLQKRKLCEYRRQGNF